ncbi:MAG TPA: thiamine pyrophosphate-dependent enzyme [Hyphomicrobiaceae bacterium]|nr:thiamine pyrophosphate-dependent enzyme [Hyphomicrobiaceae bacterium]
MAKSTDVMLERRPSAALIMKAIDDKALVIASLGTPNGDVAGAKDRPLNYYLRGAMGCGSSLALGLALAQPERRVIAFLGDAELLMNAGSLATIGVMRPKNLSIVVMDNERFGETGLQMSHTSFGIDIAMMAKGAGFLVAATVRTTTELERAVTAITTGTGPSIHVIKVKAEKPGRVKLPYDAVWGKNRFREALLGPDGIV